MQSLIDSNQAIDPKKFTRKVIYSVDELSLLAIKLVLHTLQIGRQINLMRAEMGKQTIDWYQRAVEEDNRERLDQKADRNADATEGED